MANENISYLQLGTSGSFTPGSDGYLQFSINNLNSFQVINNSQVNNIITNINGTFYYSLYADGNLIEQNSVNNVVWARKIAISGSQRYDYTTSGRVNVEITPRGPFAGYDKLNYDANGTGYISSGCRYWYYSVGGFGLPTQSYAIPATPVGAPAVSRRYRNVGLLGISGVDTFENSLVGKFVTTVPDLGGGDLGGNAPVCPPISYIVYPPPTGEKPNIPIEIPVEEEEASSFYNSGLLFLEIENKGAPCSTGEIFNKITEFKIESCYSSDNYNFGVSGELQLPFTANSKYISYTEDKPISIYESGYVRLTGNFPITYVTGFLYGEATGFIDLYITGSNGVVQNCITTGVTGVMITGTGVVDIISGVHDTSSGYVVSGNYTYLSGTGVIKNNYSGFDPYMDVYVNKKLQTSNDDWEDNIYVDEINSYLQSGNINLDKIEPANIFTLVGDTGFSINITKSPKWESFNNGVYKKLTTVKLLEDNYYKYSNYISPLAAWASLNVSSGFNSKNVVGYGIEISTDLLLSGASIYNTGFKILPPSIDVKTSDIRNNYLSYCMSMEDGCKDKEIEPVSICYTGDTNSTGYTVFLNNILNKFKSSAITEYDPASLESISSGLIPNYFKLWSGEIKYNTFLSGDKIVFNPYPFDYTGLYRNYFNSNPLYNTTGLVLTYPNDFSGINSLVNVLNDKLSGVNYPVWYPYDCISGSGQNGIYVNGGFLSANVKPLPSGNENYNNIIEFVSLRNNTGLSLSLQLVPRPPLKIQDDTKLKYLLPSYIKLEGSNDNSTWQTIDLKTGIDWLNIQPFIMKYSSGSGVSDLGYQIIENEGGEEESVNIELSEGGYETLYSFTQSGQIPLGGNCSPQFFSREITVIKPTGFPPGTVFDENCAPSGNQGGGDSNETGNNNQGTGDNLLGTYNLKYLKTGWMLQSGNDYNTGFNYDYYRVYFSGFESLGYDYPYFANNFLVKNINLYSSKSQGIPAHSGESQCFIGGNYSLQVQGYVPVILTGELNEGIPEYSSGILNFNNKKVVMKVSGLESGDYVRFNIQSGRLISNSGTGFLTDSITGTGCITTGITDWFYDTGSKIITFDKSFTNCISGSGRITGEYVRLKPSFVNQQLAQGGFLNGIFDISITTGVQFTGLAISNILTENLTGIYTYTGIVTGYAHSGYYQLISGINISLDYPVESDYKIPGPTGYFNSSAILNYGNPQEFDLISINNRTISYSSNTEEFIAPDYFSSSGDLINIINSNPTVFSCSSYVDNGQIYFNSLLSGEDGNNIPVFTLKGNNTGNNTPYFESNFLTGGKNLYQKITATGNYSGNLNIIVYSSGFYNTNEATGFISGPISTFQGKRDFTGIWNIASGNFYTGYVNFLVDNYVDENAYENIIGGPSFGLYPKVIDLNIFYTNLFNINNTPDISKLIISGINTDSGVVRYLTGVNNLL